MHHIPPSPQQLHRWGIEAAITQLGKDGFAIRATNMDMTKVPHIIATQKAIGLLFITVQTVYGADPKSAPSSDDYNALMEHAKRHKGTPYLATIRITNSPISGSTPIRQRPFHASYEGMGILTTSDRVRVW